MGFSIEIRSAGKATHSWTLSSSCLDDIESLKGRVGVERDMGLVFGESDLEAGAVRTVDRDAAIEAISRLVEVSRTLPRSFEINAPPLLINGMPIPQRGGRVASVTLGGVQHLVSSHGVYWTLQTREEFRSGRLPVRRYDSASLFDESRGAPVLVQPGRVGPSAVSKVLSEMKRCLVDEPGKTIQLVWG